MLLGQIFQSIAAWQKLSAINLRPRFAYKILKYMKLVSAECEIAEKQRAALIHELTDTAEGEDAKLEPDTPEFAAYVARFNEVMVTESTLKQLDMDFEEVVNALNEKDESFTVSDLTMLEPFFDSSVESFRNENGTPKEVLDEN